MVGAHNVIHKQADMHDHMQLKCGASIQPVKKFLICTDSVALGGAYFGMGTGDILLDNVGCRGIESSLLECNTNPIGQPDGGCDHSEDAGVKCQGIQMEPIVLMRNTYSL